MIPTLTWHFFEAPNKLTITDASFTTIIETEYECDSNFVLDEKSFDMLKKLGGPIKVNANKIEFNKYKCSNMDVVKPELYLDNIIYTHTYNATELKEATKFVGNSSNLSLQGVLFNDNGDVFATDSFKIYYKRKIGNYTRFWSVPTQFIKLLPDGEVELSFTDTMVMYNKMYSRLYSSKIPALEKVCDNFISNYEITFDIKPELTYLPCSVVNIKAENGFITFLFNDNEKTFDVEYKSDYNANFNVKILYEYLTQVLSISDNKLKIEFGTNMMRVNDKVIICYMR